MVIGGGIFTPAHSHAEYKREWERKDEERHRLGMTEVLGCACKVALGISCWHWSLPSGERALGNSQKALRALFEPWPVCDACESHSGVTF